jgi:hypothetical protein
LTPVIIKMKFKRILTAVIWLNLFLPVVHAQTMEVGFNAGAAGYMGDLNQKNPADFSGLALGAFIKSNLDAYWAVGLHYNYGKIKDNDANSSDADFRKRNINFSTPLHELSLQVDFNFLDYFAGGGTKHFTPYIFTGVGGLIFNPRATYQDQEYKLRYYKTEGISYKNYAVSIPYGVGVKFRIAERWGMLAQLGYRTVYSDYLDDVGDKYPQTDVTVNTGNTMINLSNPSVPFQPVIPGSQRGDYNKKDTYLFFHIGVSYTFLSDRCFIF